NDRLRGGRERAEADEEGVHPVGHYLLIADLEDAEARVPADAGNPLIVVGVGSHLRGDEGAVPEVVAGGCAGGARIQSEDARIQPDQIDLLEALALEFE